MATLNTMTEGDVVISDFENYGSGWSWTVIRGEYSNFTRQVEAVALPCHTNQQGNGLWINGKQIHGTAQFSLSHDRTAARRKVLRFFQQGLH